MARCRWFGLVSVVLLPSACAGCAIHYFDQATGTEHLIGFGHLKSKRVSADRGPQSVVTGMETVGFAVGAHEKSWLIGVGGQRRETMVIHDADTALWLDRPLEGGLFTVVVGSGFPPSLEEAAPEAPGAEESSVPHGTKGSQMR